MQRAMLTNAAAADKKLAIVKMAFAQSEDGPGLASSYQFLAGESAYFSCLVDGYTKSDKDEIFLTYQIQAKDPKGILLQPASSDKVEATLAPEDKDWRPKLRDTIVIPPLADSGEYQVLVKVRDERNRAPWWKTHATFTVHGRDIPPSDTLVVRDFRFFRGEDDTKPLQRRRLSSGRFAVGALHHDRLQDWRQESVRHRLRTGGVARRMARWRTQEPHAAAQKDQPFYPQRYQPGVLNLNFPKDQTSGEYTIVLTVHDNSADRRTKRGSSFP